MEKRYFQPLRTAVAWGYMLFQVYLVVRFMMVVHYFRSGGSFRFVPRPDGIEGFLPISALLSLKGRIMTGFINRVHPAALLIFLNVITVCCSSSVRSAHGSALSARSRSFSGKGGRAFGHWHTAISIGEYSHLLGP